MIELWSWQAEQEEMKDIDREAHMGMMSMCPVSSRCATFIIFIYYKMGDIHLSKSNN